MTDISNDGLQIQQQDLSAETPGADDHDRIFQHDGSAAITLTGGSTTSTRGFYLWDHNAGAWVPQADRASVTEGDVEVGGDLEVGSDVLWPDRSGDGNRPYITTDASDRWYFIGGGGVTRFRNSANSDSLMIYENQNVEIPNGSLYTSGDITANQSLITTSIKPQGSNWLNIKTSGAGGHQVRVFDDANAQAIAHFHEGGTVEIPNGNLNVGSNRVLSDGANTTTSHWNIWDSTNSQQILIAREGGNVEIPNGALTVAAGGPAGVGEINTANARIYEDANGDLIAEDGAGNKTGLTTTL